MASNGANEATSFPSTVPELLKILPKRETALQIRMDNSPNHHSMGSSSNNNTNNRHHNHHSHNNHRHKNNNNISNNNSSSSSSQSQSNSPYYHTLRYDFKPASINSEEPASLELTQAGQVTIKAPNVGGSISNHTVFRGQKRPHGKECLLVIDHSTGEMVLQKLTDNITVKATRSLGASGASGGNGTGTSGAGSNGVGGSNGGGGGISSGGGSNGAGPSSVGSGVSGNLNGSVSATSLPLNIKNDGPQLSEESSSSSSSSRSRASSTSSSSSSSSSNSSPNNEGFTF